MIKTLAAGLMLLAWAFAASPTFAAPVTAAAAVATPMLDLTAGVGSQIVPAALVATASGKIWVNVNGMTLYTFDKDTIVGKSTCNDQCATEWPPLMAAAGATASDDWTIVTRDDGSKMWAFKGHPLYTFFDDKVADDVTGDSKDGFKVAI
jgi:predicted lipoprotein with Yx(FWY)xxD motif